MTSAFRPAEGLLAQLTLLRVECSGPVVHLRLNTASACSPALASGGP